MASMNMNGVALNMYTAPVADILTGATSATRTASNWSLIKEAGAELDSINSFGGENLTYKGALPSGGTVTTWIFDDYVLGGVQGWVISDSAADAAAIGAAVKGNDARTLFGLMLNGDDMIHGGEKADLLDGFAGKDTIVGMLGSDKLYGGANRDMLLGGTGNDTLSGGLGVDKLQGDDGADRFVFSEKPGSANADRILDFDAAQDSIRLSHSVFTGIGRGVLDADQFHAGTEAASASDRIVYDDATGRLYFDADGDGAAAMKLFATLNGAPDITAVDFIVF